jgi:hypothetical protein
MPAMPTGTHGVVFRMHGGSNADRATPFNVARAFFGAHAGQQRSTSNAIPCPTPMHMNASA